MALWNLMCRPESKGILGFLEGLLDNGMSSPNLKVYVSGILAHHDLVDGISLRATSS